MLGLRLLNPRRSARPWNEVGWPVWGALACALTAQCAYAALAQPETVARTQLPPPPPARVLAVAALGDPVPMASLVSLGLQTFDDPAGARLRFADIDYAILVRWLRCGIELDPRAQYPLLLAAQVYGQVPDSTRQRIMIELVREQALKDLSRRWRWLAHASLMARHRLGDTRLALVLASDLAHAPASIRMPGWARQMAVLLHQDLGEHDAARALLGGLLASGAIDDPGETRFLLERLSRAEIADRSSPATVTRRGMQ